MRPLFKRPLPEFFFLCYTSPMIELAAFLGNGGKEYEKTRHNVAWLFASSLPFASSLSVQSKFRGIYASINSTVKNEIAREASSYGTDKTQCARFSEANGKLFFLKPKTYMNASGESIRELADFYKIKAENILVVHDELELPFGTISLKFSGGLGGHNGLRSAKANLGSADFWRLRFGIGRPQSESVADYVLSPFTDDEQKNLQTIFSAAKEAFYKAIILNDAKPVLADWSKRKIV